MELSMLAVFLLSSFFMVASHPKNSDIIPKDYYKRQILQPIPGYIPVYIKTETEPEVRRERVKNSPILPAVKVNQPDEKHQTKTEEKKPEKVKGELLKEHKVPLEKSDGSGKSELLKSKEKHEKVKIYQSPVVTPRKHGIEIEEY